MACANEIKEELVDTGVGAEFGVEGGGEQVALADENREAVAGGEGFDLWAGMRDARGADEDHLQRAAWEFGGGGEDSGVDLAAVGVALNGDVECGEGSLRGVLHVFCEEDCARAGTEGWRRFDEGLEGVEKAIALEEFEERGGLAARDDEAVEAGQLGRGADQLRRYAKGSERVGVGFECALQSEHTDGERTTGLEGSFHVCSFACYCKYR
jgi:hypothetical protein